MQGRGIQIHSRCTKLLPLHSMRFGVPLKIARRIKDGRKGDAARRCLRSMGVCRYAIRVKAYFFLDAHLLDVTSIQIGAS